MRCSAGLRGVCLYGAVDLRLRPFLCLGGKSSLYVVVTHIRGLYGLCLSDGRTRVERRSHGATARASSENENGEKQRKNGNGVTIGVTVRGDNLRK